MSENKTENPNPQVSASGGDELSENRTEKPKSPISDLTLEETGAGEVKGGGPVHGGWDLQKNVKA